MHLSKIIESLKQYSEATVLLQKSAMVQLFKPTKEQLEDFLKKSRKLSFSYKEVGATKTDFPKGYDHDINEIEIGYGEEVWQAAKNAIRNWKMFPGVWADIWPRDTPIEKGKVVVMIVRVFGLWWKNSCRIVYTFDEPNRFGFAYGTLTNHIEKGEEIFFVEKDDKGRVFYKIQAFSTPRIWLVKLTYPIGRFLQRKFVKESKENMKEVVLAAAKSKTHA